MNNRIGIRQYLENSFLFYFISMLLFTFLAVLVKFWEYMKETPFQEWWVTIIWILACPLTIIAVMMLKNRRN